MNKSTKKKNIILIVVDGLRPDKIHTSSEFSSIMERGTLFSNMITYAPYTLASMAAIFSGMYGGRNGIDAYNKMFQYKEDCKFLAEYLQEEGYLTIGDAMRLSLCPERGFDDLTSHDENSTDYVKAHSKIIDKIHKGEDPFFLYLHYPSIHTSIVDNVFSKYDDFSKEYFEDIEKNTEDYITYVKKAGEYTAKIFLKLEACNLIKDSNILLMADHGMGVGEKIGERAYGVFVNDYSLKTFCLFINDNLFQRGENISELVRTIDIMPTILDLMNISADKTKLRMHGSSLLPIIGKSSMISRFSKYFRKERIAFSETGGLYGPWPSPDEPNVKCVRSDRWKLIHNLTPDTWELYDLKNDASEKSNIFEKNRKVASKMQEEMEKIISNY